MDDRGAVTVEAAVAVCGLLLFLSLSAAGLSAIVGQLRCTDAAREAARLIARGDRAEADQAAQRIAPGARIAVREEGDAVTVEVSRAGPLPGIGLRAEAFAVLEPT